MLQGTNSILGTTRNHFKSVSKTDKMAAARRRAQRGEGRAAGSLPGGQQPRNYALKRVWRRHRLERGQRQGHPNKSCRLPWTSLPVPMGGLWRQSLYGGHRSDIWGELLFLPPLASQHSALPQLSLRLIRTWEAQCPQSTELGPWAGEPPASAATPARDYT